MYLLIVVGVIAFMAVYYVRYFANIKKAGGSLAAGKIYWREQFALDADEDVVSLGIGTWYLGPLVPETVRSTAEKVFDAISRTSYRGANMFVAFTSKGRLALAVEPTENGPRPAKSSIGMPKGYAPLAIFDHHQPPLVQTAAEAWPGSPHLPADRDKPKRANTDGRVVSQELIRLGFAGGRHMTFFVEADWVPAIAAWSRGAQPRVDPRWITPAAQPA